MEDSEGPLCIPRFVELDTMETLKSPTGTCCCPPPPLPLLQPAPPAVLVGEAATETQEEIYKIDLQKYVLQTLNKVLNDQ